MMNINKKNIDLPFNQTYHGLLRSLTGNMKLILPGVRLVARNENDCFLFVKRSDNAKWVLPGGSVEYNESVSQAAFREFLEETGLEAITMNVFAVYTDPTYDFTNAYGGLHQMFSLVFMVTDWRGTIKKKTLETSECRFFHVNQLPETLPVYTETIQDAVNYQGHLILK